MSEMNRNLVSIIVPIYNTEKYLKKCVDSILGQTYNKLEVILVNDGSSDDSLKICRKYESSDSRIIIIDKKNGGLSSARNAGLDVCKGDYITFVDSDDYLEKEAIELLVEAGNQYLADIVSMKLKPVDENYNSLIKYTNNYDLNQIAGRHYLKEVFERKKSCSVCDKLFSAKIWENRRFELGILNEDFLMLSKILIDVDCNIVEIGYYGYNYYTRQLSISRSGFGLSNRDAVYNSMSILKYISKKDESLIPFAGAYAAYQARTALAVMSKEDFGNNLSFVHECIECLKKTKKYVLCSFLDIKDRLFCICFPIAPRLSFRIMKMIRKQ